MSDEEIVAVANTFARRAYALQGYQIPVGYRFDKAHHPHERLMWDIAVLAFEMLRQTDLTEALDAFESETASDA